MSIFWRRLLQLSVITEEQRSLSFIMNTHLAGQNLVNQWNYLGFRFKPPELGILGVCMSLCIDSPKIWDVLQDGWKYSENFQENPKHKEWKEENVDPIFVKPTRSEMRPMFRVRKREKRFSHLSQKQFPRCKITFGSFSDTFRGNLPARNPPPFPAHIQHTIHVHKNQGFLAVENAQAMPRAALLDFFWAGMKEGFNRFWKQALKGSTFIVGLCQKTHQTFPVAESLLIPSSYH